MSYCQSCFLKIGLSSLKQQGPLFFDNGEILGGKHRLWLVFFPLFEEKFSVACLWTVNCFATVTLMCFCLFLILFLCSLVYEESLYRSRQRHDELSFLNFFLDKTSCAFWSNLLFCRKMALITVLGTYCEFIGSFSVSFLVREIGI
jgi:hypothetical protein